MLQEGRKMRGNDRRFSGKQERVREVADSIIDTFSNKVDMLKARESA